MTCRVRLKVAHKHKMGPLHRTEAAAKHEAVPGQVCSVQNGLVLYGHSCARLGHKDQGLE
jgi:hypothetical protein